MLKTVTQSLHQDCVIYMKGIALKLDRYVNGTIHIKVIQ